MRVQSAALPPSSTPLAAPMAAAVTCGLAAAFAPQFAMLFIGGAIALVAITSVERLAVLTFWTLPYMVANLPTGAFTLKLPEVAAYFFAACAMARAYWRRETWKLPPATIPVLAYLAVLSISAAVSPVVPTQFQGTVGALDRNSPAFRSASIVIWLLVSWSVVVAAYNVVGRDERLLKRCLRAHILGSGLAAVISLAIYAMTLAGRDITNVAGLGIARSLAPLAGTVFRLAGVAYEPLFLAFYFLTVIPVTLVVLLYFPALIPRWVVSLCLVLQSISILLTFSTGGLAALAFSLLLLTPLIKSANLSGRLLTALVSVAVLVSLGAAIFLVRQSGGFGYFAVVAEKLLSGGDDIRRAENAAGFGMFEDYPMLGVGPGMAGYHFPRYHPVMQSQHMSGGVPEVNNVYLATLAEGGIAGFAAFGIAAIIGIVGLLQQLRTAGLRNAPLLAALTASLFGCALQYMSLNALFLIYFTGLIALSVSAARIAESAHGSEP